jgi:hypothetical protein
MSSAVDKFFTTHMQPIIVLAINSFRLFEVPVVGGIPDSQSWDDRTRNKELVIYLECTITEVPFHDRFKQLGVVSIQTERMNMPVEDVCTSKFFLCIVLVTPEIDGRRTQVGTNWRFHVGLNRIQIGWLDEMPIGVAEASERFTRSVIASRNT